MVATSLPVVKTLVKDTCLFGNAIAALRVEAVCRALVLAEEQGRFIDLAAAAFFYV